MRKPWGGLAGMVGPVGTALAHAPWWVVAGAFILMLAHRALPQESKHLLKLWLSILADRRTKDRADENGHEDE